MADSKEKDITEGQQTRAYAAYYGLWVGLFWVGSFALSMWGLTAPLAGNLGLLLGICSIPYAIKLMRDFRDNIAPLTLGRAFQMAWMIFIAASLLCTAAQYIYFAYIDDGRLILSYSEMVQQPEVQEMLKQMLQGQDAEAIINDAMNMFSATPPSQLAIQFLIWNTLLATFCAFPTALFSFSRPQQSRN